MEKYTTKKNHLLNRILLFIQSYSRISGICMYICGCDEHTCAHLNRGAESKQKKINKIFNLIFCAKFIQISFYIIAKSSFLYMHGQSNDTNQIY